MREPSELLKQLEGRKRALLSGEHYIDEPLSRDHRDDIQRWISDLDAAIALIAFKTRQEQWTFDVATDRKTLLGKPRMPDSYVHEAVAELKRLRDRKHRTRRGQRFVLNGRDRGALDTVINQMEGTNGRVHKEAGRGLVAVRVHEAQEREANAHQTERPEDRKVQEVRSDESGDGQDAGG